MPRTCYYFYLVKANYVVYTINYLLIVNTFLLKIVYEPLKCLWIIVRNSNEFIHYQYSNDKHD